MALGSSVCRLAVPALSHCSYMAHVPCCCTGSRTDPIVLPLPAKRRTTHSGSQMPRPTQTDQRRQPTPPTTWCLDHRNHRRCLSHELIKQVPRGPDVAKGGTNSSWKLVRAVGLPVNQAWRPVTSSHYHRTSSGMGQTMFATHMSGLS